MGKVQKMKHTDDDSVEHHDPEENNFPKKKRKKSKHRDSDEKSGTFEAASESVCSEDGQENTISPEKSNKNKSKYLENVEESDMVQLEPASKSKKKKKKRDADQETMVEEQETSPKKKVKKRKHVEQENSEETEGEELDTSKSETTMNEQNQEEDEDGSKKKKKKKKKEAKTEVSEEESKSNTKAPLCLEYLHKWNDDRANWKFQTVRQVWLLQHMYNSSLVPDDDFSLMLEYMTALKGNARGVTLKKAEEMMRQHEEAEAESDDNTNEEKDDTKAPTKGKLLQTDEYERVRQVIQLLL